MEVKVESTEKKERAHEYIEEFFDKLKEKKNKAATFVKEDMLPYLNLMMENIRDCFGDYIVLEEVDVLDKELLVDIAQKYMVEDSNQVAAYRTIKDDETIVYLTYCRDRERLPKEKNRLVIVKAEAMNKATKELFKESDLVILI